MLLRGRSGTVGNTGADPEDTLSIVHTDDIWEEFTNLFQRFFFDLRLARRPQLLKR
jgi:hypothetical protein